QQIVELPPDCDDIQARIAREIGNAKAAADIDEMDWPGRNACEADRKLQGFSLRLDDGLGTQVLRAREDMKPHEVERQTSELIQHGGYLLGVDSELLGPACHLHPRALELEVGVHANGNARPAARST